MKKRLSSLILFVALTVPSFASAEEYIQYSRTRNNISNPNSVGYVNPRSICIDIGNNLKQTDTDATTGGGVTVLQTFLYGWGYLKTLPTGYFGTMTRDAVSAFQSKHGIASTPVGFVGSYTRAKIKELSCNSASAAASSAFISSAVASVISPSSSGFTSTGQGSLQNVTQNAALNSYVYVYGNNQGTTQNNAQGNTTNGNQGTTQSGTGTQNTTSTNTGNTVGSGTSTSVTTTATTTAPVITVLSPSSGIYGSTITILGRNFSSTSNSVNFAGRTAVATNVPSSNGTSLQFNVSVNPCANTTASCGASQANFAYGNYPISVTTPNGTSNTALFAITDGSIATTSSTTVTITSLSPSSGPIGTRVTVTGTNFSRYNNSINFAGAVRAIRGIESVDGRTLSFVVPATPCGEGYNCAQIVIFPGTYPVSVSTQNVVTSNSLNFTITSSSGSGTGSTSTTTTTTVTTTGGCRPGDIFNVQTGARCTTTTSGSTGTTTSGTTLGAPIVLPYVRITHVLPLDSQASTTRRAKVQWKADTIVSELNVALINNSTNAILNLASSTPNDSIENVTLSSGIIPDGSYSMFIYWPTNSLARSVSPYGTVSVSSRLITINPYPAATTTTGYEYTMTPQQLVDQYVANAEQNEEDIEEKKEKVKNADTKEEKQSALQELCSGFGFLLDPGGCTLINLIGS